MRRMEVDLGLRKPDLKWTASFAVIDGRVYVGSEDMDFLR